MIRARVSDLVRRTGGQDPYWITNTGHYLHWNKRTGQVSVKYPDGAFELLDRAETAAQAKRMFVEAVNARG